MSNSDVAKCPNEPLPEYAFIGRSNVGKSSLINYLCNRKKLALVSNTPGKTQMINFFDIDQSWYLVDLPGYGYARLSKKKRREFEQMIEGYLLKRESLAGTFLLLDVNVGPQQVDLDFINWLGKMRIPFAIVYTKTDRVKPRDLPDKIKALEDAILDSFSDLPDTFTTSAIKRIGGQEMLDYIAQINKAYAEHVGK